MFLINFFLILSNFWILEKIQDGRHKINMVSYDVFVTTIYIYIYLHFGLH